MTAAGDRSAGLRSPLGDECRNFLRAKLDAADPVAPHCDRCGAVLAFQRRMAPALSARPSLPAALLSRNLVEATLERVVADCDNGSMAEALRDRVAAATQKPEWVAPALESPVLQAALSKQPRTSPAAWSQVHRAILAEAHVERAGRAKHRWLLGAMTAAAAAVVGGVWLAQETHPETTIVFVDLESAPGIDFAAIRYGAPR